MRVVTVCIFCRDDDWQTSALRGDLLLHGGGETNAAVACASDWTVPPQAETCEMCATRYTGTTRPATGNKEKPRMSAKRPIEKDVC